MLPVYADGKRGIYFCFGTNALLDSERLFGPKFRGTIINPRLYESIDDKVTFLKFRSLSAERFRIISLWLSISSAKATRCLTGWVVPWGNRRRRRRRKNKYKNIYFIVVYFNMVYIFYYIVFVSKTFLIIYIYNSVRLWIWIAINSWSIFLP